MTPLAAFLLALLIPAQTPAEVIPYFVSDGKGTPGFDSADRNLAVLALEAWARESGSRVRFTAAGRESEALLVVRWVDAGQGRFGEMQRILVGGKEGSVVFVSPGVTAL